MAKHYRKSHKSRKHGRKSRRTHRRRSQRQRGGAGCAAMPLSNSPFAQRGGMAPFNSPGMLLDHPTVVQSESAQQLADIQAATTMAKAYTGSLQAGGRRRHRKSHKRSRRQQKSRKQHHSRRQRGGAAQSAAYGPFDGLLQPSLIGGSPQALGQNPQFVTEAGVNSLYGYEAGAQH